MERQIIKCYKDDKMYITYSDIISVNVDNDREYFVIIQNIYRFNIKFLIPFKECDMIEYFDEKGHERVFKKYD